MSRVKTMIDSGVRILYTINFNRDKLNLLISNNSLLVCMMI